MDNHMKTGMLAVVYATFTSLWLYFYSQTSFNLFDTIDFSVIYRIQNSLSTLLLVGFLIACSIVVLLYFCKTLERNLRVVGASLGSMIAIIIGTFFFTNITQYLTMMAFHLIGSIWIGFSKHSKTGGLFSKMKLGWSEARHMFFILGVGAFITSFVFISAEQHSYEERFKESIINATGGMDIGSMVRNIDMSKMVSRDDVAAMVDAQTPNYDSYREQMLTMQGIFGKDDIRQKVREQYADQPGWDNVPASEQARLIDQGTEDTWNELNRQINASYTQFTSEKARKERIDASYDMIMQKMSAQQPGASLTREAVGRITEEIFDQIPIMKSMMSFLPLMAGFIAFSAVTLFGTVFVGPFAALLALLLKEKKTLEIEQ